MSYNMNEMVLTESDFVDDASDDGEDVNNQFEDIGEVQEFDLDDSLDKI